MKSFKTNAFLEVYCLGCTWIFKTIQFPGGQHQWYFACLLLITLRPTTKISLSMARQSKVKHWHLYFITHPFIQHGFSECLSYRHRASSYGKCKDEKNVDLSSGVILVEEISNIIVISTQIDILVAIMSYSYILIIYKHII